MDDPDDRPLIIGRDVLAAVAAHARAAFPRECCGYLVGDRDTRVVDAAVACANAAPAADEYAIDGGELLAFARTFDSPRPALVVYHSHPNGRAYFSPRDRATALLDGTAPTYPVQHLVIGVNANGCSEAALFAWRAGERELVEVARFAAPMLR
jgi:proteasome lid subunit RPN8/RPN11